MHGPGPRLVRPPGGVSRFRRRAAIRRMGEAITAEDAVGEPLRAGGPPEDAVGEPLRAGGSPEGAANEHPPRTRSAFKR